MFYNSLLEPNLFTSIFVDQSVKKSHRLQRFFISLRFFRTLYLFMDYNLELYCIKISHWCPFSTNISIIIYS